MMMRQCTLLFLALIVETECQPVSTDEGMAPQWDYPGKMSRRQAGVVNWTIKLQCAAIGFPTPTLKWYKNGEEFKRENRFNGFKVDESMYTIIMEAAVPTDAGRYTCVVENQHGSISHTYELDVLEMSHSPPHLRARLPTNRTAVVGGDVEFECKVFHKHKPIGNTLNWIRVGPDGVPSALENSGPNTSDKEMEVLHLRNVTLGDAGEYICSATNYLGTSQKSFWLTVIEGQPGLHAGLHC